MRLVIGIVAAYLLVLTTGYALNEGWIRLPEPAAPPPPIFDEAKYLAGVQQIGAVAFIDKLVPVEGKALSDIRIHDTAYNPAMRTLKVWISATLRGAYFVFISECHSATSGGWLCTRPVDAGGYIRVN
jgi:hypothetical protein